MDKERKSQTYRVFAVCSHSAHKDERGIPFVWEALSFPITITPGSDAGLDVVVEQLGKRLHSDACPDCPLTPSIRTIIFTGGTNG